MHYESLFFLQHQAIVLPPNDQITSNFCRQLLHTTPAVFAFGAQRQRTCTAPHSPQPQSFELAELPGRMWGKHGKTHNEMVEKGGAPRFPQGFNIYLEWLPATN